MSKGRSQNSESRPWTLADAASTRELARPVLWLACMTRTKLKTHAAWVVLLVLAGGCGDSHSPEELSALVEEARRCEPGDTCVLAGGSRCSCGVPVNASRAEEVDDFARQVDCGNVVVDCPIVENVRCEANRCTADLR